MNRRSRRNILLAMLCSMFTIVMCRCYDERLGPVQLANGWTCKSFTDYDFTGGSGFECTGTCPNGNQGGPVTIPDLSQLETFGFAMACGVMTPSPTSTLPVQTATESSTPNPLETPTVTTTPVPVLPLLTTQMTSCGNYGTASQPAWWINLRLAEPRLDITGKALEVTIGGLSSPCGINQGNTSILSCFASRDVTYPALVIVKLDGAELNNFTINPNVVVCDPRPTATNEVSNEVPSEVPASETPGGASTP